MVSLMMFCKSHDDIEKCVTYERKEEEEDNKKKKREKRLNANQSPPQSKTRQIQT